MGKFLTINKKTINNLVFDKINKSGEVITFDGKQDPTDFNMVIIDAKSSTAAEIADQLTLVQNALDNGVAVMLLDAGKDHKQAISSITKFYNEKQGVAYFVAPMADKNGKRHYKVIEQFAPISLKEGLMRQEQSVNFNGELETSEPVKIDMSDAPDPELSYEHIAEFSKEVESDLRTLSSNGALEQTSNTPPAGAPYWAQLYSFKQPYQLGGGASNGHTPPAANQLLSGNATFGIYYDNVTYTNQPIQWVSIGVGGLYAANLVSNTQDEMGWMVGGLEIDGPSPTNLTYKQGSPNSVSGQTSYTAETSFSVGLEAGKDGVTINASYTETNSETKTLNDWEITQVNEDGWKFFQQNPFNGTVYGNSGIGKGLGGGGVAALPAISTSSLAFDTQTVWIANPPITTVQSLQYSFIVWPYFEWVYDPGKSWSGASWGWPNGYTLLTDTWNANFSAALPG